MSAKLPINPALISQAVTLLRSGRLVALPTETVYGLGADATNEKAIARIFAVKGRPSSNPLIVHVASAEVARRYVRDWPVIAQRLAEVFWPGPLTLVLPKSSAIVNAVAAGGDTVGVRVPDHPVALALLRAFDGPIAAPSANQSNRISPTTAQHVYQELGDEVDLILDGGPCRVGIESTVLDLCQKVPSILRPGGVSRTQIESIIGPVTTPVPFSHSGDIERSPGQLPVHYAPQTPCWRFDALQRAIIDKQAENPISAIVSLGTQNRMSRTGSRITLPADPPVYARHFYEALRELDSMHLHAIYIELPPETAEWIAVRDRIARASRPFK